MSASEGAELPGGPSLADYDAVEVASAREEGGNGSRCDCPDDGRPIMHSLYLHRRSGGVECFADFVPTEEGAAMCRMLAVALVENHPNLGAVVDLIVDG